MQPQIRVGIVGYGNLGRGVELAVAAAPDLVGVAVFSRRKASQVKTAGLPVRPMTDLFEAPMSDLDVDVLVLCGGSKSDLPTQTPELTARFNTVDSFDTHAQIPAHFANVDAAARRAGTVSVISAGWDPGLFSLQRLWGEAILPQSRTYTFWGKGLSQGHSEALRRVPGVAGGVQYTIPAESAISEIREGAQPDLSPAQQHVRECYVVLAPGADPESVRQEIVTMPDYFADYDTRVHFIKAAELQRDHQQMPHGGVVITNGPTSPEHRQTIEFRLKLESNPEFTAAVLVAYARAASRLARQGKVGAFTVLDIPPALLAPSSPEELRARLL